MNIYFKNRCLKIKSILLAFLILTPFAFTTCTNPQPPWQNTKVYTNPNQKIIVNAGDKFIIRFTMSYNVYPIIEEIYDNNMITLLDRKIISADRQNQPPVYSWFLFKALKNGETQITIQHLYHITEAINNQEIFTIVIRD